MGMADKISGKDSGGRARWRICGTTGMYTTVEEIREGNRRDVDDGDGKMGWKNGGGLGKY